MPAPPVRASQGSKGAPRESLPASDPYEGWSTWCDQEWDWACETDADCADRTDPLGHPLHCKTPKWARGNPDVTAKVCRPGAFGRARRRAQKERLRVLVEEVCQPPEWFEPGTQCWQYKPKKAKECKQDRATWCDPDKLYRLLALVVLRESTWKPYVRHQLNPDLKANKSRWKRDDEDYGWDITFDEYGNIEKAEKLRPDANPHYPEMGRWSEGIGWHGHNAALRVREWDVQAPPEVLCREVEATEVYLRVARRVWRKIAAGLDCDGDGVREFFGSGTRGGEPAPAWVDVHRGASGGKLCPHEVIDGRFTARANRKKAQIDAYEGIGLGFLGTPIPRETQNERAEEIRALMDERTF